jgi:hypothetical protein
MKHVPTQQAGIVFLWLNHKKSDIGNTDYHQKKIEVVSNNSATIFSISEKWWMNNEKN